MGLLDQVLGQVIGNMAGGAQGRPGGAPQAGGGGIGDLLGQVLGGGRGPGGQGQAGGGIGDLLGQVLGGGQAGQGAPQPAPQQQAPGGGGGPLGGALGNILGGGKLSPLLLAVLAVLASKNLSTGAGGLGTILHDMVTGGGGRQPRGGDEGGEAAPEGYEGGGGPGGQQAGGDYEDAYGEPPEGAPPYPGPQGGGGGRMAGGGGGFLDDIGSMLDGPGGAPRQAQSGGMFGGGFDDLQRQFEQNGQGDLMGSWVGSGANREAAPSDLEQALGSGTIDQLARQFGIDRNELLQQLSTALPQVVDGLTPNGRAPTEQEQRGWV